MTDWWPDDLEGSRYRSSSTVSQQTAVPGMRPAGLPVGHGTERLRLWDVQYRLLWDSGTDTTPPYRHIATWVNASIDLPDGSRWVGQMYRCPEGIQRWSFAHDMKILKWPANPFLEDIA